MAIIKWLAIAFMTMTMGCSFMKPGINVDQGKVSIERIMLPEDFDPKNTKLFPLRTPVLLRVKTTPWRNILDPVSKAWAYNNGTQILLFPQGDGSGDLLQQMSGPLSGVVKNITPTVPLM